MARNLSNEHGTRGTRGANRGNRRSPRFSSVVPDDHVAVPAVHASRGTGRAVRGGHHAGRTVRRSARLQAHRDGSPEESISEAESGFVDLSPQVRSQAERRALELQAQTIQAKSS